MKDAKYHLVRWNLHIPYLKYDIVQRSCLKNQSFDGLSPLELIGTHEMPLDDDIPIVLVYMVRNVGQEFYDYYYSKLPIETSQVLAVCHQEPTTTV